MKDLKFGIKVVNFGQSVMPFSSIFKFCCCFFSPRLGFLGIFSRWEI